MGGGGGEEQLPPLPTPLNEHKICFNLNGMFTFEKPPKI